jgi:hypothetical protein
MRARGRSPLMGCSALVDPDGNLLRIGSELEEREG